ncbi:uncharacterized protein LOC131160049 [Malania oleifera]|uniref:uncharacterized protein LOC131160049 n=1 Tax=Malania oleifera TaxID=397392 RepID=UPI0025AE6432|nr:uncharacterized protein LOC131160049 [Malania oleifera]
MDGGAPAGPSSMIKQLASCNKITRDKAFKLLKSWLPLQPQVSEEDMRKIWKGFFYCVWHSDKAPVQADLIDRLSSLLLRLHPSLASHYFSVFLLTMRREWSGIDVLRLDKFYLLIRRFLHHFLLLLKSNRWDAELSVKFIHVLEEGTFLAEDKYPADGVNYHVASILLEELKPFLPVRAETLEALFQPFLSVMGKSSNKVLVAKIKSNVFDVLVKMGKTLLEVKKLGNEIDAGSDMVLFGTIALTINFATKFYDLGSSTECFQGSRKVLFSLHEDFSNLKKDLESLGIQNLIPQINSDDAEEEVPLLVPINIDTERGVPKVDSGDAGSEIINGYAGKRAKKSKKTKKVSGGSGKKVKAEKNVLSDLHLENSKDGKMQFEKVAAEAGLDDGGTDFCDSSKISINGKASKKRKRAKSVDGKDSKNADVNSKGDVGGSVGAKSVERSAKKVRFSMKNNLVWKPHSPLPPQSLRLPPSVTPRGSALKKGLPPGPIREIPPMAIKVKVKKGRKGKKKISPAIKRLRKLQSLSI